MKRRNWDPKTKAMIVLQGLKGKPIVDICTEHQISQTQYYLWREQFLANMQKAFINDEHREKILLKENDRLKQAVGELHLQLKKQTSGRDEAQGVRTDSRTQLSACAAHQGDQSEASFLGIPAYLGSPKVCG